jgi:putative tributyrin esterase
MALVQCNFFSSVLELCCSMSVILPEPKVKKASRNPRRIRYPTLYLLHGLSDDHTIWQRRTSIERYVEGRGLAVVMPAVHRSFYTDTTFGYRYWTFISEELPMLARYFFPLSDARENNFVAGLSMGGYGAFKLALSYPDRFAAAASLSGAVNVANFIKEGWPEGKLIFGNYRQTHGGPNDLFALAEKVAKSKVQPRLFQCCGTEDFLHQDNIRFRDHARKLGLDLTYDEGSAEHEWGYWDKMIQEVLDWLPLRKLGK